MEKVAPGNKASFEKRKSSFKLGGVGSEVHVRLLDGAWPNGKHYFSKGFSDGKEKYDVYECMRIRAAQRCPYCDKFFEAAVKAKKLKLEDKENKTKTHEEEIKELDKVIREFKPAEHWYYIALNRGTKEAIFLRVTPGVRNKLEEDVASGIDIFSKDYKIRVTDKPGKDKYAVTRLDSADTNELDEVEEKAIHSTADWNAEDFLQIATIPGEAPNQVSEPTEKEKLDNEFPNNEPVKGEESETLEDEEIPF